MLPVFTMLLVLTAAHPTPAPAAGSLAVPGAPAPPGASGRRASEARSPASLGALLASRPADSLVAPLREFEQLHSRDPEGADAAFTLGQLHYARGEYRQAADAFARAAARYSPDRKPEARYWQGLSALGVRDAAQARAALEDVGQSGSARAGDARFAVALAWEQAGHSDKAIDLLEAEAAGPPGETTPAVLEHLSRLADRIGHAETSRRAAERLRREYPLSDEAMRLPQPVTPVVEAQPRAERGSVGVQIGAFNDAARARALVEAAKRAGYEHAELTTQGQGEARLYVVRIGWFPNEAVARKDGEQASRALGVAYRLVRRP
jgi:tetratricopeptide (TPR) repeat protein